MKIEKILSLRHKIGEEMRRIIANTGWLFADRILRMGVGLFITLWVARYLGVEKFGILNYATAFVALFNPICTLGLDAIVVRSIVRKPENKNEILGTAFLLKLVGGIIALILTGCSIIWLRHNDNLTIFLVIVLASVGIFQSFDIIDLWFQSQVTSKYTVIAKNTAFLITALIKVIMIINHAPLLAFAYAGLLEIVLGALGLMIIYKLKFNSLLLWRWNLTLAKTLIKESLPLILSGLTVMIYMKIDQIMLGEMTNNSEVGIYSAATRISEVWYFIPTAICSSFAPSIFAAKEESEDLYYARIVKLLRLLSAFAIAIAIPISLLSGKLITALFGKSYIDSGQILAIHIWASLFVFLGVGTSFWFIAEGLTKLSFYRTMIGAATNIIINIWLIPIYSGVGAAISTVFAYAIAVFFVPIIHPNTRKKFYLQLKSIFLFS
jgi:PST family polysaccharide transporter